MVTQLVSAEPEYYQRPRDELLTDLVEILKREGFGKLCTPPHDIVPGVDHQTWAGWVVILWASLTFGSFTANRLDGGSELVPTALLLSAGYFVAIILIAALFVAKWESRAHLFGRLVLGLIPITFLYQVIASGFDSAVDTHLFPLAVGLAALVVPLLLRVRLPSRAQLLRIGRVLGAAPWLVPITLLIVVVPLFSADLWRLASEANFVRIVALACLTVAPMVILVLWRLLIVQFDGVIANIAETLHRNTMQHADEVIAEVALAGRTRTSLGAELRRWWRRVRDRPPLKPDGPRAASVGEMLRGSYDSPEFEYYVHYVRGRLKDTFRVQIVTRVLLLVTGVVIGSATYIYLIAWIVISAERAAAWAGREEVSTWDTGIGFELATGPHMWVAALMAVIATAIFLALVTTTQEMERAFQESSTRGPVKRCLALAIPFAKLFGEQGLDAAERIDGPSGSDHVVETAPGKRNFVSRGRVCRWYEWTAPACGRVIFATEGNGCETSLVVYVNGQSQLEPVEDGRASAEPRSVCFEADQGRAYRIAVDGYMERGEPEVGGILFNWLANDDMAMAHVIDGASGTVRGHNHWATKEEGEPDHAGVPGGASVWYRWRAAFTGKATFDTAGSSFDTLLAVYRGATVVDLQEIEGNNDAASLGLQSRVIFEVKKGDEYLIAVDGRRGATGTVVLNWGPPTNDRLVAAEPIQGEAGLTSGNNTGATKEWGEPAHAGQEGGASVWYRWRAPASGEVTFDTVGSNFDTLLAVYRGSRVDELEEIAANDDAEGLGSQSRVRFVASEETEYAIAVDGYGGATGEILLVWHYLPPNDDFAAAQLVEGASGTVGGHNREATKEPGEPDHAGRPGGKSVWYRWRAPASGEVTFDAVGSEFDTLLAVYRGSRVDELEEIAANDDAEGLGLHRRVRFVASEETEYAIAVDGDQGATGDVRLNWHSPPANDHLAGAQVIEGGSGTVGGHNRGATKEPGEPQHAGAVGRASVWYRWLAPASGEVTFDTVNSGFDTLLAVYLGSTVDELEEIAANDDAEGLGLLSRVRFFASEGTEYAIAVDGYREASGKLVLNWALVGAPKNDNFSAPVEIGGTSGTVRGSNRGATKELGEPDHARSSGGASVWYRWRAPAAGEITFDTAGSGFDTLLAVYRGSSVDELEEIAANDDAELLGGYSRARFHAAQGLEYAIAVDGYAGATGELVLRWEASRRASEDAFQG
jgi:hypothetical protein